MPTEPPDMTPATRHDLNTSAAELKAYMAEHFATKAELAATAAGLASKADLAELGRMLFAEIARVASMIIEEVGRRIAIVDEKYNHLPALVAAHHQELVVHVGDRSIHHTHARTRAKKRTRRARKS